MATSSSNAFEEQEIQQLIALKEKADAESAALQAKIAAKLRSASQSSSLPQREFRNMQSTSQRQDVPRIYSNYDNKVAQEKHTSRAHRNSLPMSRSLSQRSQMMSKSVSNHSKISTRPFASNPFSGSGHDAIPLLPNSSTKLSGSLESWAANNTEDPYHSFEDFSQMRRLDSRKLSYQQNVPELQVPTDGMDPEAYFATGPQAIALNSVPPTLAINSLPADMHANNYHYGTNDCASDYSTTPALTTATTQPSEMSRQGSSRTRAAHGFAMMKLGSNRSMVSDISASDYGPIRQNSFSTDEQNVLVRGIGGEMGNGHCNMQSMDMERSSSSESNASTSSSRSRDALFRSNRLAATRELKQKTDSTDLADKVTSTAAKPISISKPSNYVRPKREPLHCTECNDKLEGYRGPHELNRHIQRAHSIQVRKWKVVEPLHESIHQDCPPLMKPITKCKSCREGKTYNADYNVAAHLRRTHFSLKSKSKGRSSKGAGREDQKPNKGSSDQPKMDLLRPWIRAVMETNTSDLVPTGDEEDYEDFDIAQELGEMLGDDISGGDGKSGGNFFSPVHETLDAYPTPISSKGFDMIHTLSQQSHVPQPKFSASNMHAARPIYHQAESKDFLSQQQTHSADLDGLNTSMSISLPTQPQYLPHDSELQGSETADLFESPIVFDSFAIDMHTYGDMGTFNDSGFPSFDSNLYSQDSTSNSYM